MTRAGVQPPPCGPGEGYNLLPFHGLHLDGFPCFGPPLLLFVQVLHVALQGVDLVFERDDVVEGSLHHL